MEPSKDVCIDEEAIDYLSTICDGDARTALNCLEIALSKQDAESNTKDAKSDTKDAKFDRKDAKFDTKDAKSDSKGGETLKNESTFFIFHFS